MVRSNALLKDPLLSEQCRKPGLLLSKAACRRGGAVQAKSTTGAPEALCDLLPKRCFIIEGI